MLTESEPSSDIYLSASLFLPLMANKPAKGKKRREERVRESEHEHSFFHILVKGLFIYIVAPFLLTALVHEHFLFNPNAVEDGYSPSLYSVGYYGDQIHVRCLPGSSDSASVVGIIHAGAAMTTLAYHGLQIELQRQGISSCAVDRVGVGYSPASDLATTPSLGMSAMGNLRCVTEVGFFLSSYL